MLQTLLSNKSNIDCWNIFVILWENSLWKLSLNNWIGVVGCFIMPLLINCSNSCFVSLNKSLHKHLIIGASVFGTWSKLLAKFCNWQAQAWVPTANPWMPATQLQKTCFLVWVLLASTAATYLCTLAHILITPSITGTFSNHWFA